jgi:large subunit ribosomal protein L9
MKVILKADVKNVGKVGQLVNVAKGYARNFLFPNNLALEATERRVKEFEHLKKMADAKRKKAMLEKKTILAKLSNVTVTFKVNASETEKLFGSITSLDISRELEKQGFRVDRRDVRMDDTIKMLGQHKATIYFGEGLETEIAVSVERA